MEEIYNKWMLLSPTEQTWYRMKMDGQLLNALERLIRHWQTPVPKRHDTNFLEWDYTELKDIADMIEVEYDCRPWHLTIDHMVETTR